MILGSSYLISYSGNFGFDFSFQHTSYIAILTMGLIVLYKHLWFISFIFIAGYLLVVKTIQLINATYRSSQNNATHNKNIFNFFINTQLMPMMIILSTIIVFIIASAKLVLTGEEQGKIDAHHQKQQLKNDFIKNKTSSIHMIKIISGNQWTTLKGYSIFKNGAEMVWYGKSSLDNNALHTFTINRDSNRIIDTSQ